ncbi:Nuclease sbcCD subunit D [uncultured Clostridium sp.]|uniref:exonuclease SbcCD subunit D n=1 Tax=uncultured Clostridium sp. TaxID=59620 RepID=UPI0008205C19|nr:exonuclease SbcCD subunit D [uncultured Clostridium sp.]SCJ97535.1 Nuclease sbcCD subunit D [uncultured Clostridium sp.]
MKIIHTGDWHIGKIVNEFSMIEDQKFYLDRLIELLEEEKPDVFIIAGDIYDRSVPPAEAVELLDNVLSKIILELNIPVLAISGNHDSPERLSFGSKLLKDKGLYIEGMFNKEIKKVTIEDEFGNVNFYLLPYVDPAKVRLVYKIDHIRTYDDAMKFLIGELEKDINRDERNVLITHGYVTFNIEDNENKGDLELSDSERPLSIGGTDLIDGKNFDLFNYVALGHLHGPQKVGGNRIRYSGSLLKYSISECRQKKSIPVIELNIDGDVEVELREIPVLRDMRVIEGPLDTLIDRDTHSGDNLNDYVFVNLTDEGEVIDAISKLRAVFPNVMGLKMLNATVRDSDSRTSASGNFREKPMTELFSDFYLSIKGKSMDDERVEVFNKILEESKRGKV